MEILKLILNIILSFFQNSAAKKTEDVKLADITEKAVVEEIRATENVNAIQHTQKIQAALDILDAKQKEIRVHESNKSLNTQLDDQFGNQ